jgi:hypothetical protein
MDRALWPDFRHPRPPSPGQSRSVNLSRPVPAGRGDYLSVAASSCGRRVVDRSWVITNDFPNSASMDSTFYMLQRDHRWLLWFVYY